MDTIMTVLQWLVPVLGTAIVWLTNRTLQNTRTVKEVHDTYKTMYEDQQKTLIELRNVFCNLSATSERYAQIVARASVCRYWPVCPMRAELQNTRAYSYGKPDRRPSGQPTIRNPGVEADKDSGVEGEPGNPDGKPP